MPYPQNLPKAWIFPGPFGIEEHGVQLSRLPLSSEVADCTGEAGKDPRGEETHSSSLRLWRRSQGWNQGAWPPKMRV
jgi:hypothetical protein